MHDESVEAVPLAHLPCAVLRLRGTVVGDLSDEACRELGRGRDELIGEGFLRSLVEADRDASATASGELVGARGGPDDDVGRTVLQVRRRLEGVTVEVFELGLAPDDDGSILVDVRDVTECLRLLRVLDSLCTSSQIIDARSNVIWSSPVDRPNPAAAPKAGIEDDLGWIHTGDVPNLLEGYADLLQHPGETRVGFFRVRSDGPDSPWVETRATAVNRLDDPRIAGIVVRSELQTALQPINQADGSFRSLAETVPIGIIVIDGDGRTDYVNATAQLLLGLRDGEAGDWIASARAGDQGVLARLLAHALDRDTEGSAVVAFEAGVDRDRTVWIRVDVVSQLDEHRRPIGAVVSLQDVTAEILAREQLLVAQEELTQLANRDSLTGLPNRAFFMDRLQRALTRLTRTSTTLAVLYCDLDGFKAVNDTLGHEAGDEVLVEAARRLSGVVRATDTVSRFGGDEFVVVCEGFADRERIADVAARLVDAVSRPVAVGGSTVSVGISIGIRLVRTDTAIADVLRDADAALYEAKSGGKGQFRFA